MNSNVDVFGTAAIGGLLAKPAEGFPSAFSSNGLFGKFPYLLPNLVCATLLVFSIIGSWLFLCETHPDMQPGSDVSEEHDYTSPLLATAGATANPSADLRAESYGTFNQVHLHEENGWTVFADGSKCESGRKPTAFTYRIVMLIIALAIFTYHSMTYDHLLPIFLQDKNTRDMIDVNNSNFSIPGGVGLSTRMVGLIMSTDGVIALFIQILVFPALAQWLGVWKLFVVVIVLHPIAYFMVPFLVFIPQQFLFVGIYACLVVRNVLSIIDYPVLLILIKQASPSDSVMGKINGLAASAGAAARTIAPPVSGYLYSAGAEIGFTALAWWASTIVAMIGAAQLYFIERKKHTSATVQAAAPCQYISNEAPKETVHIVVTDVDVDSEHTQQSPCLE